MCVCVCVCVCVCACVGMYVSVCSERVQRRVSDLVSPSKMAEIRSSADMGFEFELRYARGLIDFEPAYFVTMVIRLKPNKAITEWPPEFNIFESYRIFIIRNIMVDDYRVLPAHKPRQC